MRALWLREQTDPDYGALAPYRFTHLYRSIRDARTTIASLANDRHAGYVNGVYWASTWDADLSGSLAAAKVSTRWTAVGGKVNRLDVQLDVEQHDPAYVLDLLRAWRDLRPWAVTSLTIEGFQGGWIEAIRAQLAPLRVLLVPQAYAGDMVPFDVLGVIRDLTDYGFPAASVEPFHDARMLYRGWSGFAFDSGRLVAPWRLAR